MDVKHGGRLSKAQRAEVKYMERREVREGMGRVEGRKGKGTGKIDMRKSVREVREAKGGVMDAEADAEEVEFEDDEDGNMVVKGTETVLDADEYGHLVVKTAERGKSGAGGIGGVGGGNRSTRSVSPGKFRGEGGKMRTGQKIGGLRDKRDKSGGGMGGGS